jgi:flagellin-like hook-associated protein FlgL
MVENIALGASMRANLLSLQKTNSLLEGTQFRLSTGRKVNSALDNAQSFFAAQGLTNRANDLSKLLDGIGQSIQTIKVADDGVTSLSKLLDQADSIATQAKEALAAGGSDVTAYESDYEEVLSQIDAIVADAGYRGVNLLGSDNLTTTFNEAGSNTLTTSGTDFSATGLGFTDAAGTADWTDATAVDGALTEVATALESVRSFGSTLSTDLSIIQMREDFTKAIINRLEEGSDKLTLADPNEEGAKMLALQTRLQLGVTSLALASQSQQSVLSLF